MGVMDKFLNYMKLNGDENEDDYDDYDDDYLDDDDVEATPMPRRVPVSKMKEQDDYEERPVVAKRQTTASSKITPINKQSSRRVSSAGMEVCVIKPNSVDDAREITETLLAERTVVLNLEGLDVEIAQRIVDFICGSCFAIRGNLQKVSNFIFIVTPASVDISGDFQDIFGDSFEMPLNT